MANYTITRLKDCTVFDEFENWIHLLHIKGFDHVVEHNSDILLVLVKNQELHTCIGFFHAKNNRNKTDRFEIFSENSIDRDNYEQILQMCQGLHEENKKNDRFKICLEQSIKI